MNRAIRMSRIGAGVLVAAAAMGVLPGAGTAPCGGTDRFPGTRAAPDMLVVLNRGAGMSAPAGDAVPDLDGNGTRSRYDLALSVLFRLLNANGNRIDGLASPRNPADVPRFRRLIDIEDELYLNARIGLLPYGDGIPRPPPKPPPFGEWGYRAAWDAMYSSGATRFLSPAVSSARFPSEEIESYFSRADPRQEPDPLLSCRPRVVVLISDGSDLSGSGGGDGLPDGIDRVYALLVGVAGEEERGRLRRHFGGEAGRVPKSGESAGRDVRVAFFDTPGEVDASDVFDEIALPFDRGPWMAGPPAVPALRTPDSGFLFAPSLSAGNGRRPVFGTGSLRFRILGPDGSLTDPADSGWDAATGLAAMPPDARKVYTWVDGARRNVPVDPSGVDGSSGAEILRASEAGGNVHLIRRMSLGAILGSTPVLVGPPSPYYADGEDPEARHAFAALHSRRTRFLLAATNDGMLHAFDAGSWDPRREPAGYGAGAGGEVWAYLPGYRIRERSAPSPRSPAFEGYADGSTAVADIVVDRGDGPAYSARETEWRTYAVGGAGTGGRGYFALDITDPRSNDYPAPRWELSKKDLPLLGRAWSTPAIGKIRRTAPEEAGRNGTRGRWVAVAGAGRGIRSGATTLLSPVDLRARGTDPRSVRVENTENAPDSGRITLSFSRLEKRMGNWVPVRYQATGSYSSKDGAAFRDVLFRNRPDRIQYAPAGTVVSWTDPGDEGRAVIVLDAATGEVLQTLTHPDMGEVVAPPTVVTDGEGYIERVYVGDLEGNVWRATADASGIFTLGGKPFFTVTGDGYSRKIYAKAAVAGEQEVRGGLWIFFGTGDRENPMDGSRGAIFAVYDGLLPSSSAREGTVAITERNLSDESGFFDRIEERDVSLSFRGKGIRGWYGALPGNAEKMVSGPRVFHHNLFFSTFEPTFGACPPVGSGRVYGIGIVPGRNLGDPALLEDLQADHPEREGKIERMRIFPSSGILSGPVISIGPGGTATLYAGSADGSVSAIRVPTPESRKSIRYWRDVSR